MSGSYNTIAQEICMLLSILILFLIIRTKPRRTHLFAVNVIGITCALFATWTFKVMIDIVRTSSVFSDGLFHALYVIYICFYITMLNCMYVYIDLLSYKTRDYLRRSYIVSGICSVIYATFYFYMIHTNRIYVYDGETIVLTKYFNYYLLFGIIHAILCFLLTVHRRKSIPRNTKFFIYFLLLLQIGMLIWQYHMPHVMFVAVTYTFPFVIFYILFHSNPYAEEDGTQNYYSFIGRIEKGRIYSPRCYVACVRFPQDSLVERYHNADETYALISDRCREVEGLDRRISICRLNNLNYAIVIKKTQKVRIDEILRNVYDLMQTPVKFNGVFQQIRFQMIAYETKDFMKDDESIMAYQEYLFRQIGVDQNFHQATEEDIFRYQHQARIRTLLLDIQYQKNLDDPRVLCFAQPIYEVKSDSFQTAEALMRMQFEDGTMIYPDEFIPVAEQTGCIHMLTCIILNKVCSQIEEWKNQYDFEAISVNVSSKEMSDPHLHEELMNIISVHGLNGNTIRLELTESAVLTDYNIVMDNFSAFRNEGVQFYLDDFGTGYSNIERIITCPFKTIKFDKSILYKAIENDAVDMLVTSMIAVFKKQGFLVLVEGVENDVQRQFCVEKGFDYIQGYHYAKPSPMDHLTNYFNKK